MIVRAQDISCIRGGRLLFSGLSFCLMAGESLILRGPNGVGKSSLLRTVSGLIQYNQGIIEKNSTFMLADEHLALDSGKSLREALLFWAHIDGASGDDVAAALSHFALAPLADVPVRMLSTGQRKRAILARTMASGARLWLLDEPGNGLDSHSLTALGTAMEQHVASGGAIIAASHFDLPHNFTHTIDLTEMRS